ncbi:OmpA family protein [Cellulomonas wangleii]|uniref:OmpA family protein n=1 Tax=Cellulomonas wangleii TaxID=2816956 RepID=UPI0027DBDDE4|nr:OmpA family protein [Cellulomonas wangleii]
MRARGVGLAAPVVALLLVGASPAPALTVEDFPEVSDHELARAVVRLSDKSLEQAAQHFAEAARIRPLAGTETQGEETVVTLATDILFAVDDATVPPSATDEIGALLADVPDGAALAVEGHTDSVASDAHNQDLSERRAAAVADVVRAARPDLVVTAAGHGETRLTVEEAGDDVAEDRAQNRRVELRHTAASAAPSATAPLAAPTPLVPAPPRTGTAPAVRGPAAEADAVAQTRLPAPGYPGIDLVVGVEDVRVRGAVTELSLLVELDGPDVGAVDRPSLFGALDQTSWDVTLVDRAGLLQYPALRVWGVIEWHGEGDVVSSDISSVQRFVITFPRLLSDEGPVDVVLDPALPAIADVPVTRE